MSTEREFEYRKRMCRIPEMVMQVANNNQLVHKLAQEFGHGNIITLDECLSQMIVQMDRDWSAVAKRNYELLMNTSATVILPQGAEFNHTNSGGK